MAKRKSAIAKALEVDSTSAGTPAPAAKKSVEKDPDGNTPPPSPAPVKKTPGNRNDSSI